MSVECIACQNPVRARQQGLQCDGCLRWQHRTCGDPAISTSRRADHLRLRESSVGSPEESDAAGQTAGMRVSLDAGSMEKGEVQFQ